QVTIARACSRERTAMTLHSLLGKFFRRKTPSTRGRVRAPRHTHKSQVRLVLEALEDRTLPSCTTLATLELFSSGSSQPVSVPVDSYRFGVKSPPPTGGTGGGAAGRPSFDQLIVNTEFSSNSPGFFDTLASGDSFVSAVLTQQDADGNTTVAWALKNVHITGDTLTDVPTDLPTEQMTFAFEAIREATSARDPH